MQKGPPDQIAKTSGGTKLHAVETTRSILHMIHYHIALIHKFKLNYLLIKPTKTICFHAMRPPKYQNNNTESLMGGPDFVYASGLDHSFF